MLGFSCCFGGFNVFHWFSEKYIQNVYEWVSVTNGRRDFPNCDLLLFSDFEIDQFYHDIMAHLLTVQVVALALRHSAVIIHIGQMRIIRQQQPIIHIIHRNIIINLPMVQRQINIEAVIILVTAVHYLRTVVYRKAYHSLSKRPQ